MDYERTDYPSFTRRQLFDILQEYKGVDANERISSHVNSSLNIENCPVEVKRKVLKVICRFTSEVSKKWESSNRTLERFLTKNADWLKKEVTFPEEVYNLIPKPAVTQPSDMPGPSRAGRPQKSFSTCSAKTKKRKTQHLIDEIDQQELTYAAQVTLRTSGKKDAAQLVKEITETTPRRATKIKRAFWSSQQSQSDKPVPYTGDEALSLIVEAKLTKHQYLLIRSQAKERKADIYPSYQLILQSKQNCYPESIKVTDTSAEVKLQSLLDHTATRLVAVQSSVIQQLQLKSFKLISKWGCDGSTGQSEYKQRFQSDGDGASENKTDKDLFVTCLVPLQLTVVNHSSADDNKIIWQNPRPSSTRFCRPIRFQFCKETTEVSVKEAKYIDDQIEELQPTKVSTGDETEITVSHKLVMTMVDGKVCNAITSTKSAQLCYICGASPKEMNNLLKVSEKAADPSNFCFGLSTLHAWIRFFECLLHISYRLETKKWQVRGAGDQQKVKERKQVIVDRFRSEMGLLVDQPKSGGSGTTNDGNSACRFFKDSALSSAITGINRELIDRFGVILQALASGFKVNPEAFEKYAMETARFFVELYPWYYMPASVHIIPYPWLPGDFLRHTSYWPTVGRSTGSEE